MLKKFTQNDIFTNRVKAHPSSSFFAYSGSLYYNKNVDKFGVPNGHASLYEGLSGSYPFITKRGTLDNFKTISTDAFSQFSYGDVISGEYPLTATVSSSPLDDAHDSVYLKALKNTLNYYSKLSPHYQLSSSLGDKSQQKMMLLSVPSIFYGSAIDKGSVSCKFYVSGTLIAELRDENKNGDLIQVGPSGSNGSGSVAGSILYNEGFLLLTGSWSLHDTYVDKFDVYDAATNKSPAWRYFLTTGSVSSPDTTVASSSFELGFRGTNYIPTITMLAHAGKGEFNHSNNPTYTEYGQTDLPYSSSTIYRERDNLEIKNMADLPYTEEEPKFEKVTYISKIGIYDDAGNLIAIAKLATPVRKREIDSYTFKLKLDI